MKRFDLYIMCGFVRVENDEEVGRDFNEKHLRALREGVCVWTRVH